MVAAATAHTTNDAFSAVINGEVEFGHEEMQAMWNHYKGNEGVDSPNADLPDAERMANFRTTLWRVIKHNKKEGMTWKSGINAYSDMTDEQFNAHFNLKTVNNAEQHCSATENRQPVAAVQDEPDAWDWRAHGGVTPVKNQGHCGSCWTFSTVGCLEAHMQIKYGSFTPLAEQQLVDCAQAFDNHGCNGGLPSHAFEYVKYAGGISTEDAYPYNAEDNKCTVDAGTFALEVDGGSFNITEGDEPSMKSALYGHGPVSIAFQVVDGFRDYSEGVYTSDVCKNTPADVNHAVLAVGYGTLDEINYWDVKNSWGADWGDSGFFKIERGVNMCGVAMCNSYPQEVKDLTGNLGAKLEFLQ